MTAAWLLGRIPEPVLPWPLVLRTGRAGRGAGPDIRDAAVLSPAGVPLAGDVEVHVRASDFARHGHPRDPAYGRLICHLVWIDDRAEPGTPLALPGGGTARTVALASAFGGSVDALRAAIARGPRSTEPCARPRDLRTATGAADAGATFSAVVDAVRHEGARRLAERAWHAQALAAALGWDEAWRTLLQHALEASAGRRAAHAIHADPSHAFEERLGAEPLRALAAAAHAGAPRTLIALLQVEGLGAGRAAEVGWNAALPLLAALAHAHGDAPLARAVAALVAAWPAPRPYGRTRALAMLLGPPPQRHGALYAQGLLRLHELWCARGGCGACPLSAAPADTRST